ncbi:MAG TPA: phage exclusion protein Lit family protein, partial [Longimicrobiaceae bacterium]|nr:phage exclusion protein Lit family protein [Longimicrobiaceae bacterium]
LVRFQHAREHTLARHERSILAGKVSRAIRWDTSREALKSPSADPSTGQVVVSEVFMAYLWAVAYALLVIDQEGYRRPLITGRYAGEIDFTEPVLAEARDLFFWAMGLRRAFSDWPAHLPAPGRARVVEGIDYTGVTNGLFTDAAAYLLFHEYAHLVHDHWNVVGPIRAKRGHGARITDEERETLKQLETEADVDAREALLVSEDPDGVHLSRGLAIVIAHAAALLAVVRPSGLQQGEHPDVDSRLVNAIYALTPDEVGQRDVFWTVASLACDLFLQANGLGMQAGPAETGEELLRRYLAEFDRVKSSKVLP